MLRVSCLFSVLFLSVSTLWSTELPAKIIANDNRSPAGELRDGTLYLSLELREGQWHPENEEGHALNVYAFGETGRVLQNPGPLIRVPQGTQIEAVMHNVLPVSVTMHGFYQRSGTERDSFKLEPGETSKVRFNADVPGTYYYWASTTDSSVDRRTPIESQLAGAFIVDPPGTAPSDRIFVIGVWYKEVPFRAAAPQLATINGKSWPYTERFNFQVGETVRWRWLNPSVMNHGMHLHGFFFRVNGVGDGNRYRLFGEPERPQVVTQYMERGGTFDMTWVPERQGRWLFHCHMMMHMMPPEWRTLVDTPEPVTATTRAHDHSAEAEQAAMGGLILGITVNAETSTVHSAAWRAERRLQLTIDERPGSRPRYTLQLHEANREAPTVEQTNPQLIGPPIVLARGQPVEIEVVNHSTQPTAIHWHGIELESYYDGVPGWTGAGEQTTPPIQAGQSFVARMTPPRAGTFIYHSHWHDQDQFENGLYGPLIVLTANQKFDTVSDRVFLFSAGIFEPFGEVLLINGSVQPQPLRLTSGTKYRFRLINISVNHVGMMVSLRKGGVPVQWRIVAKDGADLSPSMATLQNAEMHITVGETYDVQYEANAPQELALEIYLPGPKLRVTQALIFSGSLPSN